MATGVETPTRPQLHPLLAEFDQQCGQTVTEIAEMFAELESMRRAVEERLAELALAQAQLNVDATEMVSRNQWQAAIDERDRLRQELDAANTELARQATVSSRLAEVRQELAAEREASRQARDEAARLGEEAALARQLREELEEVETELDLVRKRSNELAEALAEQRRVVARERAEWASELKQLRQLLERQSDLLAKRYEALSGEEGGERGQGAERQRSEQADDTARRRERRTARLSTPPAAPANDPALESALAQFSRVQKDAQKRRWNQHADE